MWKIIGKTTALLLFQNRLSQIESRRTNILHKMKKRKEDKLNWPHLAQQLPCKTRYWRKYTRKNGRDEEEDVSSYMMVLRKRQRLLHSIHLGLQ
jgi:hypothetical protein